MREIRLSGSEGGGTGNSTGPPYPYPLLPDFSVGAGHAREMHPTSGRPPRQIQNAVQQHNLLIVPTLQRGSAILTLQRHQTGSTPRREAFFSLPAQRKEPVVWSAPHHCERAALPLRRPRSTG